MGGRGLVDLSEDINALLMVFFFPFVFTCLEFIFCLTAKPCYTSNIKLPSFKLDLFNKKKSTMNGFEEMY